MLVRRIVIDASRGKGREDRSASTNEFLEVRDDARVGIFYRILQGSNDCRYFIAVVPSLVERDHGRVRRVVLIRDLVVDYRHFGCRVLQPVVDFQDVTIYQVFAFRDLPIVVRVAFVRVVERARVLAGF